MACGELLFLGDVRYVTFDLNGTLVVENYLRHNEVLESILKFQRRGRALTAADMREVSKGRYPLSEVISQLYQAHNPKAAARQFLRIQASRVFFNEGALAILKTLQKKYDLILCSDTTGIAKEVVRKLRISRYFTEIFYSCDVGYLKSEKGFWAALLSHFPGAKPSEFLVVGDNPRADTYQPKRLGMHTVHIENPLQQSFDYREPSKGSEDEKPEYSIKSLEEITILLSLQTYKE